MQSLNSYFCEAENFWEQENPETTTFNYQKHMKTVKRKLLDIRYLKYQILDIDNFQVSSVCVDLTIRFYFNHHLVALYD